MGDPDQESQSKAEKKKTSRSTKNEARNPERLDQNKKCSPQQTNVYIRIHDVIHDIRVLADVLTAKVNAPGVKLTPTETCIRRNDHFTFCTLSCESKADAKKLKHLIIKDRTLFTPLIDCSFTDFVSAEEQAQAQNKTKLDLQCKVEREFDARSEQVLRQHEQKLTEAQEKIDSAKDNLRDLYKANKAREEIAALEHKQNELQKQKNEFTTSVREFHQKLALALKENDFYAKVQELRKKFGVECCRLEKALPMYARRHDIIQLVQQSPVSILLAETGSGKSTQVVQYLLDSGLADHGTIVCTQPRKVAAVSLATHVAQELAGNVGKEVGYKAGTRVKTSSSTKIVYMTDHALLNECLTDPDLKGFSCVVVDEAHERSLYTDLLLSMVKRCVRRRPELRVIITSATIDPQVFVNFFGTCPIMKVSGRAFPVDVIWQDCASEENDFESYMDAAVTKAVDIHVNEPAGDILVFLTSAIEIQKCCDIFQQKMKDRTDFKCFQLHGQLQPDEQQKVFEPLEKNKRKIVFSTNCAETSITIDGIKYVVDTGVAKEMRYDPKRNIRSLEVTIISQSSAVQRKGRAGRTAPGKCYRLYSERSFQSMTPISLPEILKTHLGHALLKLAELGVTPDLYDFVQSPSPESIEAALTTLHQLGAMQGGTITGIGRWITKLPFDPKLGLMTLYGHKMGLLYDSVVLAALISAGSGLFYRGLTEQEHKNLDKSKLKFCHPGGDSITSLQVYKEWQAVDEKQKNKWCGSNSINAKVIRGVRDTVNEVCKVLKNERDLKIAYQMSEVQGTYDLMRKNLLLCNASNLCHYLGHHKAGYFAAQASKQVHCHPSSAICFLAASPQWLVYDQLLHTSRHFLTGITPVEDEWVQQLSKRRCGFDVNDIRQKKLENIFTLPAGSRSFFAVVGPKYSKLRQLQENWGAQESKVVMIDASQDTGEIKVFCTGTAEGLESLTQELTQVVQNSISDMQQEAFEAPIGDERSGLRVLLGQGAATTEILMPRETRKVFIQKTSADASEDMIKQKFQAFGKIVLSRQFSSGTNWGFLIFQTTAQAKAAAEGTKEDEVNVAQLENRRFTKNKADFKARLSWNRRPARGFAFATVAPVYLSKFLALGSVYIGGCLIPIKLDRKKGDSLYLTKLPKDVTEDLIKRSLLHSLQMEEDAEGIVEQVSVPRVTVESTNKQELSRLERVISREIESRLTSSTVQVSVFQPKTEKTAMFLAEARFSDPIEGLAACTTLQVSFTLNGVKVNVEPVISASLPVSRAVHDACKPQLDEVITRLADMGVEIMIKPLKADSYLMHIKASDTENVVQARSFLNDVIRGDVLECNDAPAVAHLLTPSGRQMLKEAEKEASAYVAVDNRCRTVAIHGSAAACTKVRLKIDQFLQKMATGTCKEITLSGHGKPPGLLKALYDKYGEDLDLLRQQTGLHAVVVDYHRHKLKLSGPADSVQTAKQNVDTVEKAVATAGTSKTADSIDCTACFCAIDQGDLYRLEACAHPFCKGCIARQASVAIKDRHFPVLCCHGDCNHPLAWRDFSNLSRQGHLKIPELGAASLSAFVLANRDKARFCTTPDCPMAYRVTTEDKAENFLCPECQVRICTACHEQAHDGMSCAALRSSKNINVGGGIQQWVSRDPKNRKACPGCNAPIEKTGGCNKMQCSACGAIFCWLCTQKFPTDSKCYDHLTQSHNGIFAVQDLLYNA